MNKSKSFGQFYRCLITLLILQFICAPALLAEESLFYVLDAPPFADPPNNTVINLQDSLIQYPYPMPQVVPSQDVQRLEEAYRHFRQAGYREPVLSPKVVFEGAQKPLTGIFRFDFSKYTKAPRDKNDKPIGDEFSNNNQGIYIPNQNCTGGNKPIPARNFASWIALNTNTPGNSVLTLNWINTHELFHAVQNAYPLFDYGCADDISDVPNWIHEGSADTAAGFITELMLPAQWKKGLPERQFYHNRSYRIAFQDRTSWEKDDWFQNVEIPRFSSNKTNLSGNQKKRAIKRAERQEAYRTAGFWKFLAQRSVGKDSGSSSSEKTYRLLASLIPLYEMRPSVGFERIDWFKLVDEYIENRLQLLDTPKDYDLEAWALYGWLPEFFTEYATWWDQAYPQLGRNERDRWHKDAYGACEVVRLKPSPKSTGSSARISLQKLQKNSARCIHVELSGFSGPVSIKARAEVQIIGYADGLHLGLARVEAPLKNSQRVRSCWDHHKTNKPSCLLPAKIEESPPVKTWKKTQYSAETLGLGKGPLSARLTYVLSNVHLLTGETIMVPKVDLVFSVDYAFGGSKTMAPPASIRWRNPAESAQLASPQGTKQLFYRLFTSPPTGYSGLFPIEINALEDGEQPRCGGDGHERFCAYDSGGDYYIKPGPGVQFGMTGRITATVYKNPGSSQVLASTWCSQDADKKAVDILDSNDEGLVLRINTPLCDIPSAENNYCNRQATCPERDHLVTTLTLAFGREHFAESSPVHVLTPGTVYDMALYYRYGVPTQSPGSSSSSSSGTPVGESGAGPASSSGSGSGAASGGGLLPCDCSCEEMWASDARGVAMKAEIEAGAETSMAELSSLTRCVSQCQREYMICRFEADEAEKAKREEAKKKAANPENCDCSCATLATEETRGAEMRDRFESGGKVDMQELQGLMRCMPVCQQERMDCLINQQ